MSKSAKKAALEHAAAKRPNMPGVTVVTKGGRKVDTKVWDDLKGGTNDGPPQKATKLAPTPKGGRKAKPVDMLDACFGPDAPGVAEAIEPAKAKKAKADPAGKPKKTSALDAAHAVLVETGAAMTCPDLIAAMATRGLWSSPGGKTPAATLYAAILREIGTKGDAARFTKTERGKFAAK